jgi:hypothetical protein
MSAARRWSFSKRRFVDGGHVLWARHGFVVDLHAKHSPGRKVDLR